MTKTVERIKTQSALPSSSEVVIIGGGIIGVNAALALAERKIPVVLLDKGHIAGEQSSRNLGWIRKTSRHAYDVPLAVAADRLWARMPERIGRDVGYRQAGIMFLAANQQQLDIHRQWLESVKPLSLDSRLLEAEEIDRLVPGGTGQWAGGIYTPSDGRAEPAIATSAMARAAMEKGAVLVQNCAVRTLSTEAGAIRGVVTERGEIRCDQVLVAGGAWSRRFMGNFGVSLPALPLNCTVLRTKPMEGPTEIAVGGPDFSFRKHRDGGFIITQRGALDAPLLLDHLLLGPRYLNQWLPNRKLLRVNFGKPFFRDLALGRHWPADTPSPFEKVRILNPPPNPKLNQEALCNLRRAWPVFENAEIEEAWAGCIDITPDSMPVIDRVEATRGLYIATGFSGHGFGTGPAAGQLAADLISGEKPIIDPGPYRLDRFK